jgi:hypothetical protein
MVYFRRPRLVHEPGARGIFAAFERSIIRERVRAGVARCSWSSPLSGRGRVVRSLYERVEQGLAC